MNTSITSIIRYTTCPLCQSESIEAELSAKDHTVSGQVFDVWKCRSCGCRFTQAVPDEEHIGAFYESEEYISHSNTSKGLVNSLYQTVRNYTLNQKQKLIVSQSGKSQGSILDIGCGTGEFLGKMKSVGWETRGLEPSESARTQAKENHDLHVSAPSDLFQLQADTYDVITMWHVLEHVHKLHEYLDQIQSILKQDGKLIIAVPNYESLDAAYYGEKWAAYDVPRH
ncbi:MAG: class I SAM-dependent methyltransferase, partial [Bacteroidota bacterium]